MREITRTARRRERAGSRVPFSRSELELTAPAGKKLATKCGQRFDYRGRMRRDIEHAAGAARPWSNMIGATIVIIVIIVIIVTT
jgi:hypothetical protein